MDIEKICRTCLGLSGPLLSIYDGGDGGGCIADMLWYLTKSKPRREDKLPEKVCLSCISEINRCYSFKLKCENSSRTLRQLVPDALPDEANEVAPKSKVEQAHKGVQTKPEHKKCLATTCTQTQVGVEHTNRYVQTTPMANMTYSRSTSPIIIEQYETSRFNTVKSDRASGLEIGQEIEVVESGRLQRINNLRHALSLKRRRLEEETELEGTEIIMELHTEETEIDENTEAIALYSTIHEDPDEINENTTAYYQFSNSQSGNESEKAVVNSVNSTSDPNEGRQENDEYEEEEVYAQFVYTDDDGVYNAADVNKSEGNYSFMVFKNESGEAEILTKRSGMTTRSGSTKKKNIKKINKEELKCRHCSMTFVSAKRLARHELKRHGNDDARRDGRGDSKEKESTTTTTTSKSLLLSKHSKDNEDNESTVTTKPTSSNATSSTTPQPIVQETKPETLAHFCDTCGAGFALRRSLIYHRKQDLCNKVTYNCKTCERVFISEEKLKEHKSTHLQEHECTECNQFYSTSDELSNHMISVHKRNIRNQCPHCKKVFTILSALKDHLRVHSGEKPFVCDICNKSFSQKPNLKQHIMRHSKEKKFKCDECPMSFVTKGELCSHKRTHTGEHPFRCDECQATFTISSSLVKHKRIHTGERPYACDLCLKRFTSSFTLKNHRRMHTGEKPYKCRFCNKTFTQKQDCIIHHRTHTGERNHVCFCGEKFTHLGTLRTHMKTHVGDDTDGTTKAMSRGKRQSTQEKNGTIKRYRESTDTAAFNVTIVDVVEDEEAEDDETTTVLTVAREDMERLVESGALRSNEENDTEEKLMQLAIEKA